MNRGEMNRGKIRLGFVFAALLSVPAVLAADPGSAQYGTCVACHGADGAGNVALNAPALTGQTAAYVERQLSNFRNGLRGAEAADTYGMQMRGMASTLGSDEAVSAVAAYIAALPSTDSPETVEFDQRNGENQYNAACGACHGGKAQGNPALQSPRLASLDGVYIKRQYQNFAAGLRGNHPDDRYGRQMKMMSTILATDKDLDDVIGFILSQ
jgi:cytochrome c553